MYTLLEHLHYLYVAKQYSIYIQFNLPGLYTLLQEQIQGGHRGQMTPFQTVLILKQALQIIIVIGACTLKHQNRFD